MRLSDQDFLSVVRNTPLVSIDLVVRDGDGRVLLGMRRNEPAKGCWFVPGGRIAKDERLAHAFQRLCRAELNIDRELTDAAFLGVFEHLYGTNFAEVGDVSTHYVVLAYSLTVDGTPEGLPRDQHHTFRWFQPDQIFGNEEVHPYTQAYFVPDRGRG